MIQKIKAESLKKKIDGNKSFRLIEVLSPDKYNEWHLPGAENIPLDDLETIAPLELKKDEEIVVYCASYECQASTKAAYLLNNMGYRVLEYEGGKKDWKEKGFPVEN